MGAEGEQKGGILKETNMRTFSYFQIYHQKPRLKFFQFLKLEYSVCSPNMNIKDKRKQAGAESWVGARVWQKQSLDLFGVDREG